MIRKKNEPKIPANADKSKDAELDIQEIGVDEACNVTGGSCAGCTGCGSACAAPPEPPVLNQV